MVARAGFAALVAAGLGAGVAIGYGASSGGSQTVATAKTSHMSAAATSTPATEVDTGLVDIDTVLGDTTARAAGTGMVLTSTGIVLTNNHVVEGATSISVRDVGNGRTYRATVLGYDETKDLAVMKLTGASGLGTVTIGDSASVAVGEAVVAIGNAGGTGGTPHVADGTVTALDQSIVAGDAGSGRKEDLEGLIETDAGVEAGDSGGPLVTTSGVVIGMDTAASTTQSASFGASTSTTTQAYAIAIDTAISIAKAIEAGRSSSSVHLGATAFLGVRVEAGNDVGGSPGALVAGFSSGSPAEAAGMSPGDVITGIDGNTVTSPTILAEILERYRPGESVTVTFTTATGTGTSATVKLGTGPVG